MKGFLKAVSLVFHPLFAPIAGTLAYFIITPKYSPLELQSGNILPIFILTVIIPIISYLILRNLGLVTSIYMPKIEERKYPLYINIILLFLILYKVIPNNYTIELYYFFVGLIGASTAALLLLFLNLKSSMHLMGMGSLLMFMISLSIHFEINITIALSILTLFTGLVASSRLYLKAHSKAELFVGFCLGILTQLLTVKFWL
ncbi:hypothetical protein [Maribacter halichondriae]|uniref:hypothetical protein n=1 Tax=Maribacter halichondriae TaxID=2980554 RepID=UPI00235A203F|nr:hypothetical protein [Maribacter sp. Hal144]